MRLLLILLALPLVAALEVSELLPDPDGNDNGKEFIELIGPEGLAGCTVTDDRSSDTLTLVKPGNEVILIVEEDGVYNDTPDATIYHAGKAIGNGLGNAADTIAISCDGTTLVNVSYDVSVIEAYAPGRSLVRNGSAWTPATPTPGIRTATTNETPPAPPIRIIPVEEHAYRACNATLAITVSGTEATAGDTLTFTIVSEGYASFVAEADGAAILEGDTLTRREYGLLIPEAREIRIAAEARQCDARQRAVRTVTVLPKKPEEPVQDTSNATANASMPLAVVPVDTGEASGPPEKAIHDAPVITARVVYDNDRNAIPWVAAFGIVTLLVSAWLFVRERSGVST